MKTRRILAICTMALALAMPTMAQTANKTVRLNTVSDKLALEKVNESTKVLTITRTLFAGYNTICLPFNMSEQELIAAVGEGVQVERMAKLSNDELYFLDCTAEGIEAGKPYLIYSPAPKYATFKTTDINNLVTKPQDITIGNITMTGLWQKFTEVGYYGIPAQQETDLLQAILVDTEGTKTFLPTRCSFKNSKSGAKIPQIKHVTSLDDEDSIQQLIADNAIVNVYTVNGTLVRSNISMSNAMSSLPAGIYVTHGQKFIVK